MLPFECLVLNMEPIEREKQNGDQPYSSERRLQSRQFHSATAISESFIMMGNFGFWI